MARRDGAGYRQHLLHADGGRTKVAEVCARWRRRVHLEHRRGRQRFVPVPYNLSAIAGQATYDETVYECLERCLQALGPTRRELVRHYYRETRAAEREALAKELGTNIGTLRVRVFRLVKHLHACVKKCVGRGGG